MKKLAPDRMWENFFLLQEIEEAFANLGVDSSAFWY
jgi:hypothetical protein